MSSWGNGGHQPQDAQKLRKGEPAEALTTMAVASTLPFTVLVADVGQRSTANTIGVNCCRSMLTWTVGVAQGLSKELKQCPRWR